MVRIHFVDGTIVESSDIDYEELRIALNANTNAKFLSFKDMTVVINNITYIERKVVKG